MSTQTEPKRNYIAPDIEFYEVRMDERIAASCNSTRFNWGFWEQANEGSCWESDQGTLIGS